MLGIQEPSDHKHRATEKPPALGTFPNQLELEACKCGARRFAYIGGGQPPAGSSGLASRNSILCEEDAVPKRDPERPKPSLIVV